MNSFFGISMTELNRMLLAEGKPPLMVEELRAAFGSTAPLGQVADTLHLAERMHALSPDNQARVRQLANSTSHSWASAIAAVEGGARPRVAIPMPALANINLPTPKVPRGKKQTRRQRRK